MSDCQSYSSSDASSGDYVEATQLPVVTGDTQQEEQDFAALYAARLEKALEDNDTLCKKMSERIRELEAKSLDRFNLTQERLDYIFAYARRWDGVKD